MSLRDALNSLGFVVGPSAMPDVDAILQDDSDGLGPYIRHWLSAQPCPFPDMIREPYAVEPVSE